VIGSFAITSDPIIMALGLGLIGAMFVRSITVYLVRKGTLADYVYLEHGAHWAIGTLAVILLWSTGHAIDEVGTGLVGVAIILVAVASSWVHNRRHREPGAQARAQEYDPDSDEQTTDQPREGDDAALRLHGAELLQKVPNPSSANGFGASRAALPNSSAQ
jgi:hypothetical protein